MFRLLSLQPAPFAPDNKISSKGEKSMVQMNFGINLFGSASRVSSLKLGKSRVQTK